MGYIRYYVVPAELEITPRRIAEEDKMQNWWLAGYIRSCCQLSFHHQLLDYCLQAKMMLCFIISLGTCLICLGQTVSAACIVSVSVVSLWICTEFGLVDLCFVHWYILIIC
jgi:hypothetical protein